MATFTQGKADFINKWNKDWTLKALLLIGLPSLILTLFLHIGVLGWLFFIISFSCFDIYGYQNIETISSLTTADITSPTMNYRIIQNVYYVIALILVGMTTSWIVPILCVFSHLMCTCDWLFYFLQKDPTLEQPANLYPWLNGWSIFLILQHLGMPTNTKNFTTMALLGAIIAIVGILLF